MWLSSLHRRASGELGQARLWQPVEVRVAQQVSRGLVGRDDVAVTLVRVIGPGVLEPDGAGAMVRSQNSTIGARQILSTVSTVSRGRPG